MFSKAKVVFANAFIIVLAIAPSISAGQQMTHGQSPGYQIGDSAPLRNSEIWNPTEYYGNSQTPWNYAQPTSYWETNPEYNQSNIIEFVDYEQATLQGNGVRWFSSIDATFLRPSLDRPNASGRVFDSSRMITARSNASEIRAFHFSPRITLGAMKEQRGIVFRFWQLEFNDTLYRDPTALQNSGIPARIGVAFENIDLDVYTMDVELMREIQVRDQLVQMSIGPRYVEYESSAYTHVSELLGANELATIDTFGLLHYDGAGLTGGLSGIKPLRGGWNLFWSGRASGIYGDYFEKNVAVGAIESSYGRAEAVVNNSTVTTVSQSNGTGRSRANASAANENSLYIFEGQLGLRYSRSLNCMPADAFLNFGLEYQFWNMPDAYTDTAVAIGAANLGGPRPQPSSSIDFIGFNISTGLKY